MEVSFIHINLIAPSRPKIHQRKMTVANAKPERKLLLDISDNAYLIE